jgi:hypothetical protein
LRRSDARSGQKRGGACRQPEDFSPGRGHGSASCDAFRRS